jgi:hypothetical protein
MSRLIALFAAAGLSLAGIVPVQAATAAPLTKDGYAQAKKDADAQYKIDRETCASLSGNAKDICIAEAKGKDDIARAEAAVAYENTPKTRENARVARARAAYDVSMEKCDDLAGNKKAVCVKEAKAALVRGKADARIDRVASDARKEGTAKQTDTVKEANAEKRDADFPGRDREMRCLRRLGEGRLHRQREDAVWKKLAVRAGGRKWRRDLMATLSEDA